MGTVVLIVLALGVALLIITFDLRSSLRHQILGRDAQILDAVAFMLLEEEENDPITVAIKAARLKGVLAIRLFDEEGRFDIAFPLDVTPGDNLAETDLASFQTSDHRSLFHEEFPIDQLFELPPSSASQEKESILAPVQEVLIPLRKEASGDPVAFVQFLLDGHELAQEFADMDVHLMRQSLWIFTIASLLVVPLVGWTFHRYQKTNALLHSRTQELLQANHELAMTSKTSAVGAVTAHLIHGLRNPLASLNLLLNNGNGASNSPDPDQWSTAADSAQQMQKLINNIVRIIREQNEVPHYELTLEELSEILQNKVRPKAESRSIPFTVTHSTQGILDNRQANLVLLILENLVHNAMDASPPNQEVQVFIRKRENQYEFEVIDHGPGIPDHLQRNLFQPMKSTKADGGGFGLAICRQLAQCLNADLKLAFTGPHGSAFTLSLPAHHPEPSPA